MGLDGAPGDERGRDGAQLESADSFGPVVQEEARLWIVRVLVEVVDAVHVEGGGATHDSVYVVPLLQQQLRETGAALTGDARNQLRSVRHTHPCSHLSTLWRERRTGRRLTPATPSAYGTFGRCCCISWRHEVFAPLGHMLRLPSFVVGKGRTPWICATTYGSSPAAGVPSPRSPCWGPSSAPAPATLLPPSTRPPPRSSGPCTGPAERQACSLRSCPGRPWTSAPGVTLLLPSAEPATGPRQPGRRKALTPECQRRRARADGRRSWSAASRACTGGSRGQLSTNRSSHAVMTVAFGERRPPDADSHSALSGARGRCTDRGGARIAVAGRGGPRRPCAPAGRGARPCPQRTTSPSAEPLNSPAMHAGHGSLDRSPRLTCGELPFGQRKSTCRSPKSLSLHEGWWPKSAYRPSARDGAHRFAGRGSHAPSSSQQQACLDGPGGWVGPQSAPRVKWLRRGRSSILICSWRPCVVIRLRSAGRRDPHAHIVVRAALSDHLFR